MDTAFHAQTTKTKKRVVKALAPQERRGVPDTGRIAKLFVGQGYGIIRLKNGDDVFFHRSDLSDGTSINGFTVGDEVAFDRIDDAVSGARALAVRKHAGSR